MFFTTPSDTNVRGGFVNPTPNLEELIFFPLTSMLARLLLLPLTENGTPFLPLTTDKARAVDKGVPPVLLNRPRASMGPRNLGESDVCREVDQHGRGKLLEPVPCMALFFYSPSLQLSTAAERDIQGMGSSNCPPAMPITLPAHI